MEFNRLNEVALIDSLDLLMDLENLRHWGSWGLGYGRSMERPLRDLGIVYRSCRQTLSLSPALLVSPSDRVATMA